MHSALRVARFFNDASPRVEDRGALRRVGQRQGQGHIDSVGHIDSWQPSPSQRASVRRSPGNPQRGLSAMEHWQSAISCTRASLPQSCKSVKKKTGPDLSNALSSAGAPSRRSTRARRAWPSSMCPRPAQLAGADLTNRLPPHCRLHCGARRRSTSSKICAPLGHDPAKAIARGILVGRGTSRCRWRQIARHRARHSARHSGARHRRARHSQE